MHLVWLSLNLLVILGSALYIWVARPHTAFAVTLGQLFAQMGILFFLVNVNMYFIFLVIKKTPRRQVKISLARLSRLLMKGHIPFALFGTTLILLHAGLMLTIASRIVGFAHPKMLSGYLSFLLMALTLLTGYRRYRKASGFRRKFHLVAALVFACVFLVHLFLPL